MANRDDMNLLELLARASADISHISEYLDANEKLDAWEAENLIYKVIQSRTGAWAARNQKTLNSKKIGKNPEGIASMFVSLLHAADEAGMDITDLMETGHREYERTHN